MREIRTSGLTRGKSHRRQRRGVGLYSTQQEKHSMESRMREIRTYGLTRGKSHHAPQKLRFGGYIAEGNPKL